MKIARTFILSLLLLTHNALHSSLEEMAVMMGAQQGAMIANQLVTAQYQSIFKSIGKDQQTLQNAISEFSQTITTAQKEQIKDSLHIFSQAQQHISDNQGDQQEYAKQMQEYIFKAVSIQKPKQYYLLQNATYLDELFSLGTMYTPPGKIWKNPFSIGNWEYDQVTDSFWQLHNAPLLENHSEAKSAYSSAENAIQNSIFTEYFTHKESYIIQCEVTLHQIQYPFFVGLMFNKTRWISGNQDSITKCRMIGLYGSTSNNINVYFAEQFTPQTKGSTQETVYPIQQIVNQQVKAIQPINKQHLSNLATQPTTFVIKVITSPQKIQCKVWPKKLKEPRDYITLSSNDPSLYVYQNIGFASPGAIAQFKIIKPTDLLFSQEAIQQFEQEVEQLLKT